MRDLRGQLSTLADRNRLGNAVEDMDRFLALMRLVHSTESGGCLREFDHL